MTLAMQNRYQKMIVNVLAKKMGPAADDFVRDVCRKIGTKFEDISPRTVEQFARQVELDAVIFVSAGDAALMANVIRNLKWTVLEDPAAREAYEVCSVEGVALPPENGKVPIAPQPDARDLRPAVPGANVRDDSPPDAMDLLLQQPGVTAVVCFREGLPLSAAGSIDSEFLAVIAEDLVRWASSLDCIAEMGQFVQMTNFYRDGNVLITSVDDDYLCIVTTPGIHFGQIRRLLRDLQTLIARAHADGRSYPGFSAAPRITTEYGGLRLPRPSH
jgi:predicted regulator of Ras-like GTPase activity (Roadblock/LC7/MglB family)